MNENPSSTKGQHIIFYGVIAIALVGALCILVLNLNTTGSALVSDTATTSALSDTAMASSAPATAGAASTTTATSTAPLNIQFEIETTPAGQQLGLGNRANVPDNYAMLFAFPNADLYGFWMKDMEVPLDITWLSDTGVVLGIEANVATSTYPNVFYPPKPVHYVLETKAGFMQEHGITVGDVFPDLPTLPKVSQ